MSSIVRTTAGFLFLASLTGLCLGDPPTPATPVYEENFDSYADGEQPSSILEVQNRQIDSGETIGGRYAINNGNRHMLMATQVKDFDLTFTVEPHPKALRAPQLVIEFRTDPQGLRGYRISHWTGTYNRLDLFFWDNTASPPVMQKLASPQTPALKLPVSAPVRFRLSVHDSAIELSRDDQVLLKFTDPNQAPQASAPGNITFSSFPAT